MIVGMVFRRSRRYNLIFSILLLLSLVAQTYSFLEHSLSEHKIFLMKKLISLAATQNVPSLHGEEWAKQRKLEPGYGGFWPGDPNAKKYSVKIKCSQSDNEYSLMVPVDRYIFHYFEEQGIELPIINKARMCQQGCCTVCSVKLVEGKVKMDTPLGLLKEMRDQGYALSCCSYPRSDIVCILQNEDEVYIRQWAEGF